MRRTRACSTMPPSKIADALEKKSCGLALRAIEFRLKLHGVIQDRRIAHHYHIGHPHPDADLEQLDPDAQEELDSFPFAQPRKVIAPAAPAPALATPPAQSLPSPRKHAGPKPERR